MKKSLKTTALSAMSRLLAFPMLVVFSFSSFAELPALRVRASNPRLIEDANGKPFFVAGTCPQNILRDCQRAQVDAFFANRQAKHFNLAQVNIFSLIPTRPDPVDAYGNHFFLNGEGFEPSNINPAYMSSLDYIIDSAANHNQYVMIDLPVYNLAGTNHYDKIPGVQYYHLGQYLGKRWKNHTHVLFMFGNDGFVTELENQLWNGIKENMPNALTTTDANRTDFEEGPDHYIQPYEYRYTPAPNNLFKTNLTWLTLDGWYNYIAPSYAAAQEYNRPRVTMPSFISEAQYEEETFGDNRWNQSDGSARMIRNQEWAEVLWGGSGFGIYGKIAWTHVMTNLDEAGALSAQYCMDFFSSRPWYDLVPDQHHVFLTSQGGTPPMHDEFYTSAALTSDRRLGLVYYPGNSGNSYAITVNMAQMAGTTSVRWFDPSNGAYRAITGSPFANAGSQTFNIPGTNSAGNSDWVLVLETK